MDERILLGAWRAPLFLATLIFLGGSTLVRRFALQGRRVVFRVGKVAAASYADI